VERMFEAFSLGALEPANRFVFPPIKLGYGSPDGRVADRQMLFYGQIAREGPGVIILEPVSVTPEGREHPRQLCVHLPESPAELSKIVHVIHREDRLACLHLNHAGAAANPKLAGGKPKAPSVITCPTHGQESDPLEEREIETIMAGYQSAAEKAVEAGFDLIEIQAGHGYLVSQFLNGKINKREDPYGGDRLRFAREALSRVREGAPNMPLIMRISGSEMSPEFGITDEDLLIPASVPRGISTTAVYRKNPRWMPCPGFMSTRRFLSLQQAGWAEWTGSGKSWTKGWQTSWRSDGRSLPMPVCWKNGEKERMKRFCTAGTASRVVSIA